MPTPEQSRAELEARAREQSSSARFNPADPTLSNASAERVDAPYIIRLGQVTDVCNHSRTCLVNVAPGIQMVCPPIYDIAGVPFGPRKLALPPPGSNVLVVTDSRPTEQGFILGPLPAEARDPADHRPSTVDASSASRPAADPSALKWWESITSKAPHFGDGAPLDTAAGFEAGDMTDTGTGWFADAFMARFGGGEGLGLTVFQLDQLLRLSGLEYERFSGGDAEVVTSQHGQVLRRLSVAFHSDERMGAISVPAFDTNDDETWQADSPHLGPMEPTDPAQNALWRYEQFFGAPVGEWSVHRAVRQTSGIYRGNASPDPYTTMATDRTSPDGRRVMSSSQGFVFAKHAVVPGFRAPDDVTDPEYPPTGNGSVQPFPVSAEHPIATASTDHINWATRGEPFSRIRGRQGWAVDDEPDGAIPALDELATKHSVNLTEGNSIVIDRDGNSTRVYLTDAVIAVHDDGSITVYDAARSQIKLAGGNVEISTAGDISLDAGRNIVMRAGQDIQLHAETGLELLSNKSVFMKADHNMSIACGVSGIGGLLIDSRGRGNPDYGQFVGDAVEGAGIIINSSHRITAIGQGIALTTEYRGGDIFLDAADSGAVVTRSNFQTHWTRDTVSYFFSNSFDYETGENEVGRLLRFGETESIFPGNITCAGLFAANGINAAGSVNLKGGMFTTDVPSGLGTGEAGVQLSPNAHIQVAKDKYQDDRENAFPRLGLQLWEQYIFAQWYGETFPLYHETFPRVAFTYRDDYGEVAYAMATPTWAKTDVGRAFPTVVENGITVPPVVGAPDDAPDIETYPFPGVIAWTETGLIDFDFVSQEGDRPLAATSSEYDNINPWENFEQIGLTAGLRAIPRTLGESEGIRE